MRLLLLIAWMLIWGQYAEAQDLNSTIKLDSEKPAKTFEKMSLLVPGFVVHGVLPDNTAAANMPRKLVPSGDAVITTGLGLEYTQSGGVAVMAAMLKDCYNNLAGILQVGGWYQINRNNHWGWTVGVYARETPYLCGAGINNNGSNCILLDTYDAKFVTYVNGESVDIMPMPFLQYSYTIYRSRNLQVNLRFMGNGLLNEFGLDIPM